jgi:ribosomal protein L32
MPVPKKRTSSAVQGQRRSHDALKAPQLVAAPNGSMIHRRLLKAAQLGLLKTRNK